MDNFENDILGFDPSQLKAYSDSTPQSQGNSLIYKTKPAESKDSDGHYRSRIKIIYNPYDFPNSVIEQQGYSMQDKDGFFYAVSRLTNGDTSCPIFKAWKKSHFAKKEENLVLWQAAAKKEEGGKQMFDKRFARYVTIQVIEDKNQPDLVGKYMFWKLPKTIWEVINKKQHPAKESNRIAIPVMDFLFGRAVDIDVAPGPDDPSKPERRQREISYSCEISNKPVSCTYPDGTPLLNDDERKVLNAYVARLRDIWDEEDIDKARQMEVELKGSQEKKDLSVIYRNVIETIKGFCPNVAEEMGYKEWSPELTDRVNKWIDAVLAGNNPATSDDVPATLKDDEGTTTSAPTPEPSFNPVAPEDDLPF